MPSTRTCALLLAAALAACSGGGGGGGSGGGGGGGSPIACTLNSDCPIKYACISGTCVALGTNANALQVASYTPTPVQGPLWVKDVLTVTFSDVIRLGPGGIVLQDSLNGYLPVAADLTLSADERTVTIAPKGLVAPAVVQISFGAGLTDNWGHRCSTAGWGWDYPSWIPGYPGSVPATDLLYGLTSAVDGAGAPYVAWVQATSTCGGDLRVRRSDGRIWSDDSGRLPLDTTQAAAGTSLAARGGTVAIAWVETPKAACTPNTVRVAKRNGAGSWALVGGPARTGAASLYNTSLALDAIGNPVVAWDEGGTAVRVARFDGTAWAAVGGALGTGTLAFDKASLAMGPGDAPCVAIAEYVTGTTNRVARVYCWSGVPAAWSPIGGGTASATPGADLTIGPRALAFDAGGAPFVGWARGGGVEVATFGGTSWATSAIATLATSTLAAPELAVDPTLGVVAGWSGGSDVGAATYGAGAWHLMPKIVDVNSMVFVGGATFAAGPNTGPWGAWRLNDTAAISIRSVRDNR